MKFLSFYLNITNMFLLYVSSFNETVHPTELDGSSDICHLILIKSADFTFSFWVISSAGFIHGISSMFTNEE